MALRKTFVALLVGGGLAAASAAGAAALQHIQTLYDFDPQSDRVDGIVGSPDGRHVYTADINGGISAFSRDGATGLLTFMQRIVTPAPDGRYCEYAFVAVSPDGSTVYATCTESEGPDAATSYGLTAYRRDPNSGLLTFVQGLPDVLDDYISGPWHVAVSPDGARVYLANHYGHGGLAVFTRNTQTGALTRQAFVTVGDRGAGVAVSPDGAHVYLTSEYETLAAWRATPSGLDLIAVYTDSPSGALVDGGDQIVVSSDGRHVYATALDAQLGAWTRDPGTGALSFLERVDLGVGYTDRHEGLGISPDGRYLVATADSGQDVLLSRDPATGHLTRLEQVNGLGNWVSFSPDGRDVYIGDQGGAEIYRLPDPCETPATGCRQQSMPGKGSLVVKDDPDHRKDTVVWKWQKGSATTVADFGDPRAGTGYALCLYDRSGAGGTLALKMAAAAPPGRICRTKPCWALASKGAIPIGYNFTDALRTITGMNRVVLRQGGTGAANITAKAGGAALDTPAPPFTGTVTVQLKSSDGVCWQADYSTPLLNQPGSYRAHGD